MFFIEDFKSFSILSDEKITESENLIIKSDNELKSGVEIESRFSSIPSN